MTTNSRIASVPHPRRDGGVPRMLADLAHVRGLSIGLKNDLGQVPELLDDFDFAVNEQCVQYAECDRLLPFIRAGKAVFHAEYNTPNAELCPQTTALGFSSTRKNRNIDAPRGPLLTRTGGHGRGTDRWARRGIDWSAAGPDAGERAASWPAWLGP